MGLVYVWYIYGVGVVGYGIGMLHISYSYGVAMVHLWTSYGIAMLWLWNKPMYTNRMAMV